MNTPDWVPSTSKHSVRSGVRRLMLRGDACQRAALPGGIQVWPLCDYGNGNRRATAHDVRMPLASGTNLCKSPLLGAS